MARGAGRGVVCRVTSPARRLETKPSTRRCTVLDCLRTFTEQEVLDGENCWKCPKCKKYRRASKRLSIFRLPKILVVHLKRFGRDAIDGPLVKIGCPVDFPLELDLAPFVASSEPY